jgi:pSer/pThr/pTyr-binding forkhead associated (FHA) protein
VTDSRGAVTQHIADSFPYIIGRSTDSDLRVEAPGIFEKHASIHAGENARFVIRAEGESFLLRNGESIRSAQLAPGDEITIGSARLLVSLAPARQKSLSRAEFVLWLLLAGVVNAEAVVIALAL